MHNIALVIKRDRVILSILVVFEAPCEWAFLRIDEISNNGPQSKNILPIKCHFIFIVTFLFHVKRKPLHNNFLPINHKRCHPQISAVLCEYTNEFLSNFIKCLRSHASGDGNSFFKLLMNDPPMLYFGAEAAKNTAQQQKEKENRSDDDNNSSFGGMVRYLVIALSGAAATGSLLNLLCCVIIISVLNHALVQAVVQVSCQLPKQQQFPSDFQDWSQLKSNWLLKQTSIIASQQNFCPLSAVIDPYYISQSKYNFCICNGLYILEIYFVIKILMYQSSTRNVVWFCVALTIALIVYSIARQQLWVANRDCHSIDKTQSLEGQAFVLNKKINQCKAQPGNQQSELIQHNTRRLLDCQKLQKDLAANLENLKNSESKNAATKCSSAECYDKLNKCENSLQALANRI